MIEVRLRDGTRIDFPKGDGWGLDSDFVTVYRRPGAKNPESLASFSTEVVASIERRGEAVRAEQPLGFHPAPSEG